MKSLYKIFLTMFVSITIHPEYIVLITYKENLDYAQKIKMILQRDLGIPELIVKMKYTEKPCVSLKPIVIQFCVTYDRNVKVAYSNQEIIDESYSIFLE